MDPNLVNHCCLHRVKIECFWNSCSAFFSKFFRWTSKYPRIKVLVLTILYNFCFRHFCWFGLKPLQLLLWTYSAQAVFLNTQQSSFHLHLFGFDFEHLTAISHGNQWYLCKAWTSKFPFWYLSSKGSVQNIILFISKRGHLSRFSDLAEWICLC